MSNTIRKGIISPDLFTNGTEDVFIAGNVAALSGTWSFNMFLNSQQNYNIIIICK